MKIAIIDRCITTAGVYSLELRKVSHSEIDHFEDPMQFFATKIRKYDLIISEFYFDNGNLNLYWKYFDPERVIILTGKPIDWDTQCLLIQLKDSLHARMNIISLAKAIRPSLHLILPVST